MAEGTDTRAPCPMPPAETCAGTDTSGGKTQPSFGVSTMGAPKDKLPQVPSVDPFHDHPIGEVADVRQGEDLDWDRIESYLRQNLPSDVPTAGSFAVLQFPNGAANLTYLIRFGDTELVLRRPPFGRLAPGAHDMKREYRVLSQLWRHFDRAPRAFLLCDDPAIAGADFFVMQRRCGEVIRGIVPTAMRQHADVGRRVGLALIDAIAEFHLLEPTACGLDDLGRPDGFVQRQVRGWKTRWDLVAMPENDEAMSAVHARLETDLPAPQRVSLVHNDLKLDNCMFDPGDPDRVTAFFDWDMTTRGDPLIDLGTLLNYWPDPMDHGEGRGSHPGMEKMGLPTRDEVRSRYAAGTGLEVSRVGWYEAFAQWKTAVVVAQLHHRWVVGDSTDPRMQTIATRVPALARSALQLLEALD